MTEQASEMGMAPAFPEIALSPYGRLYLDPPDLPEGTPEARSLCRLWNEDTALGLLELAGGKWDAAPSASYAFWRGFVREYLTAFCHTPGLETDPGARVLEPGGEFLARPSARVQPMMGSGGKRLK